MRMLVSNYDQVTKPSFDALIPISRITRKRVSLEQNHPLVVTIQDGTTEDIQKIKLEFPDWNAEEIPST